MMIKSNLLKTILFIIITLFISISCSEDFLDTKLTGVSTEEFYYSSIDGISQLVTGTYAGLNVCAAGLHTLDVMYIAYGSIASDEAEAGGEQGAHDIMDFQRWDQGDPQGPSAESKGISENNWGYNYKVIARANQALTGVEYYREKNSSIDHDSAALLDQFEGELEFIRAFTIFKLTQIYGGVPIIDHILGSEDYDAIKRNSVAECLHFVQERLLIAIELLPEKSQYAISDMGRATKGAAKSLLAKAYLYESSYAENYSADVRFTGCENKYSLALQNAEEVMQSGEYRLVGINGETFDTYWNQNGSPIYTETPGFRYIFSVAGENSDESIFETQAINDGLGYMQSRGSYLTIYMGVRNVDATTLGWGFNCPTEDLLNAFEDGDPRKIVTIGETGDPIYVAEGWGSMDCMASPTNMISRKYEVSPEEYWTNQAHANNGPTNFPYIRYADVILMAAEASLKTGADGNALTYVNMIRKRARNGESTGVPADLPSVTFNDIIKERQLELALEGHRFFDLVRWGKTDVMVGQELQKYLGGVAQPSPAICDFTVGVNEFFPLPSIEIINANGNFEQYDGYE